MALVVRVEMRDHEGNPRSDLNIGEIGDPNPRVDYNHLARMLFKILQKATSTPPYSIHFLVGDKEIGSWSLPKEHADEHPSP
jgi:hypothetical protein